MTGPYIQTPEQAAGLRGYIVDALNAQDDPAVASAAARQLDRGAFRIVSSFGVQYVVQLDDDRGGWVDLVRVPASAMGLTSEQILFELEQLLRQHHEGTNPGGLADQLLAQLGEPPVDGDTDADD